MQKTIADDTTDAPTTVEPLFKYAVVDLASAPQIYSHISPLLRSTAETLFVRKMPFRLLRNGPWLLKLSGSPQLEEAIIEVGAESHWGCFVHASIDIVSMRQTLRRFNLVQLPDAETEFLFRYWDPRVMRLFLEVATKEQRRRLFEFIDRIEAIDGSFDVRSTDT